MTPTHSISADEARRLLAEDKERWRIRHLAAALNFEAEWLRADVWTTAMWRSARAWFGEP